MTPRGALRIACALAAGVVLASLPFLQYRCETSHRHGGVNAAGGH